MQVDKTAYLALVTTLAAGGAGGYVAGERQVLSKKTAVPETPVVVTTTAVTSAPTAAAAPPASASPDAGAPLAGPTCDAKADDVGAPGDCPQPIAPIDEGGCGSYATQRCQEYKQAMKPRIAQAAVECLNRLTPAERCDRVRVDRCGHLALMTACIDDSAPVLAANTASPTPDAGAATTNAAATNAAAQTPAAGPLGPVCDEIAASCQSVAAPLAPTRDDCRRTLSGLNEAGRAQTIACVKQNCWAKGMIGCEASPVAKPPPIVTTRYDE